MHLLLSQATLKDQCWVLKWPHAEFWKPLWELMLWKIDKSHRAWVLMHLTSMCACTTAVHGNKITICFLYVAYTIHACACTHKAGLVITIKVWCRPDLQEVTFEGEGSVSNMWLCCLHCWCCLWWWTPLVLAGDSPGASISCLYIPRNADSASLLRLFRATTCREEDAIKGRSATGMSNTQNTAHLHHRHST